MTAIERLISEYHDLIDFCNSELEKQMNEGNLEIYIKGKKEAYERIVTDLEKLRTHVQTT